MMNPSSATSTTTATSGSGDTTTTTTAPPTTTTPSAQQNLISQMMQSLATGAAQRQVSRHFFIDVLFCEKRINFLLPLALKYDVFYNLEQ